MALDRPELAIGAPADAGIIGFARPEARGLAAAARLSTALWRYLPILLLAAAWEGATRLGLVSPLELPALDQVFAAWWGLLVSGDLVSNGAVSLARGAAGLGLAIAVGTTLGVLMAWYRPVRTLFNPLVQALYPMPKSALIPVMVLWLGFGSASKVVFIFIGCMLPITLSAFNGARGADQVLIWSARSMGASRTATLLQVVVAERIAGNPRRRPHRARLRLRAAGDDRADRRAPGLRLHDRLARRRRRLRRDVRGGADGGAARISPPTAATFC